MFIFYFLIFIIICISYLFAAVDENQEFDLTDGSFVIANLFHAQNSSTYDLLSLQIHDKLHHDQRSPEANNLMGVLNLSLNNLTEAIYYFKRACEFNHFKAIGFINNLASALNRLDIKTCAATLKEYINYLQLQHICAGTFRDYIMKSNTAVLYETVLIFYTNQIKSWESDGITDEEESNDLISIRQDYIIHLNNMYVLTLYDMPENYKLWQLYVAFHHHLYTIHKSLFQLLLLPPTTNDNNYNCKSVNKFSSSCDDFNFHLLDSNGLSHFPHSSGLLYMRGLYLVTLGSHAININHSTDLNDINVNDSDSSRRYTSWNGTNIFRQAITFLKAALINAPIEPDLSMGLMSTIEMPTALNIATVIDQTSNQLLEICFVHCAEYKHNYSNFNETCSNVINSTSTFSTLCGDCRTLPNVEDLNTSGSSIAITSAIWRHSYRPPYSLHLGCSNHNICTKTGYIIQDVRKSISTHIVGKISHLTDFPSQSVGELYSSHNLEHLSYYYDGTKSSDTKSDNPTNDLISNEKGEDVCSTLIEWRRVMVNGGRLRVSVPDSDIIFSLYTQPHRSFREKALLMSVIYGGQNYEYNYHKIGFHYESLSQLLQSVGFCNITRVDHFQATSTTDLDADTNCSRGSVDYNNHSDGMISQQQPEFQDTSVMILFGSYISLNIQAFACFDKDEDNDSNNSITRDNDNDDGVDVNSQNKKNKDDVLATCLALFRS